MNSVIIKLKLIIINFSFLIKYLIKTNYLYFQKCYYKYL